MKNVFISGFVSVFKLAIKLFINCFLLGPLAIVYALLTDTVLATQRAILVNETEYALLAILIGGFFCSFACMAASMLVLLPIALWEINQQNNFLDSMAVFKKYLPVPVLLSVLIGLIAWTTGACEPLRPEAITIIISFYLTASSGLYLMSRQLYTSFTNA